MCSFTDIRTNKETVFKALEHFLHVYSAAEANFEGEDYGCMSNRGAYPPVIVAAWYPPFAKNVQILNLRSSYTDHCTDDSLPGAVEGDPVPRALWVKGVHPGGLLLARAMIFESTDEAEQRLVEMIVCNDCKEKGIAMLNPKNRIGKWTDFPTSKFVVCVSVMRKGGLGPELKLNPQRLQGGNYKITAAKWGNSTSAPFIMCDDARLLWLLHKQLPPAGYKQSLLFLENASSTKGPGILFQDCA